MFPFNLIGWCIFGLIAGAIARMLVPGRDRMGCREREPDRAAAAEQLLRVGRGLAVTEHLERRRRRQQRSAAEREIEGDHVSVGDAQGVGGVHGPRSNHIRSRRGAVLPYWQGKREPGRNMPP